MRIALLVAVAALIVPFAAFADDPKPKPKVDVLVAPDDGKSVREIPLKGVTPPRDGKVATPTEIKDAATLEKTFSDATVLAAIKKEVDFTKEKLVYFAWSGSGQDKIAGALDPTAAQITVVFKYTPGLTRDLRPHVHLFAIPAKAVFRVDTGK
jgi:hypothetical protein